MSKTQPARGMRDFLPVEVRKRNYVISVIKSVYEKYGFEPLETPSVENLETLTGKYGEEGNQLIFKILKRGEKLDLEQGEKGLSDLALRYDLTVPLARVVANNKNELPKFFKRYQIQPVWRADRPARGRYREFYQCDVDAIGSKSMIVEAELISAVCEILEKLGFDDFVVKINHREILTAMLEEGGVPESKHTDVLITLDKIDKIGLGEVLIELVKRGIESELAINLVESFQGLLKISNKYLETCKNSSNEFDPKTITEFRKQSNEKLIDLFVKQLLVNSIRGIQALPNLESIIKLTEDELPIIYDASLARGLSYYTGAIFEIVLTKGDFAGSIGGGGRYDGLIGMFGKEEIPACGFSLGLERIFVVMNERGMFPESLQTNSADVMVTIWNEESIAESLKLANELRQKDLRVLVYPEADKLGKQFKYAGQINVPFVCILGENELAENKVAVKNMLTGEQEIVAREEVAEKVKR